ncbi:MAG: hypothetical protein V5A33_01910 [Halobacteriales archaeon]|jgi:hypothetical protein
MIAEVSPTGKTDIRAANGAYPAITVVLERRTPVGSDTAERSERTGAAMVDTSEPKPS